MRNVTVTEITRQHEQIQEAVLQTKNLTEALEHKAGPVIRDHPSLRRELQQLKDDLARTESRMQNVEQNAVEGQHLDARFRIAGEQTQAMIKSMQEATERHLSAQIASIPMQQSPGGHAARGHREPLAAHKIYMDMECQKLISSSCA